MVLEARALGLAARGRPSFAQFPLETEGGGAPSGVQTLRLAARAPWRRALRLSALHRGDFFGSRAVLPGTWVSPVPVQRGSSRTGRSAGRTGSRIPPSAGLQTRPAGAASRSTDGLPPDGAPRKRDGMIVGIKSGQK